MPGIKEPIICERCRTHEAHHTIQVGEDQKKQFICCSCFIRAGNQGYYFHPDCVEAMRQGQAVRLHPDDMHQLIFSAILSRMNVIGPLHSGEIMRADQLASQYMEAYRPGRNKS